MRLPSFRKLFTGFVFGVATSLVGLSVGLTGLGAYLEEDVGLNWLFSLRGAVDPPGDSIVVGINRDTGAVVDLGEMPRDWPRRAHGQLLRNLMAGGASVVGFDIDFHDPRSGDDDRIFAEAVATSDRVVLFERFEAVQVRLDHGGGGKKLVLAERRQPPVEVLANAAKGIAPWPLPKDRRTVYQFWTFKPSSGGLATLPAAMLQLHLLDAYEEFRGYLSKAGAAGVDELPRTAAEIGGADELRAAMMSLRKMFVGQGELSDAVIAAAGEAGSPRLSALRALVNLYGGPPSRYLNFYGPPGSVETIQFHDAYRDATARYLDFEGRAVFVGFSDLYNPEQPDRFHTVFTSDTGIDLSGVEIAATAFSNLLHDSQLKILSVEEMALLFVAAALLFTGVSYLLPAFLGAPLLIVIGVSYFAGAQYLFNTQDVWLPTATLLLVELPLALFAGLMGQYVHERGKKLRATEAIHHYLPESVISSLEDGGVDPSKLNQVRRGTCLATDMSGFTSLAEGMAPAELATYMNTYFDSIAEVLKQHSVDVTEFHADTIMCAWLSTDMRTSDYRQNAALASLAVVDSIEQFNERMGAHLVARVGLDDGSMYVGHTGGGGRLAYSILGDCANTAARLESLNKDLGTHLLATAAVVVDLEGVTTRNLGYFSLVGKAEATAIFEIIGTPESVTAERSNLLESFAMALRLFQSHDWSGGARLFRQIAHQYPEDGPTAFYLRLCERYLSEPAPTEAPEIVRMLHK